MKNNDFRILMSLQVEQVLKENPTLPRIFQCSDLLSYFRSNQTDLTAFLTEENNFKNLLLIIHKTKDSNIIRLIHGLFTSYNTSLLKMFPISREYTLNLIDFFDNKSPNYIPKNVIANAMKSKSLSQNNLFFMISSCFDILYTAFYNWTTEMFNILNSSVELSTCILTNIQFLPVFTFCQNMINLSPFSQPFIWFSYKGLMGTFGPGGSPPSLFVSEPIVTCKEPTISVQQRIPILTFITSFFNKYKKESQDISKVIQFALPVLLQKSTNNSERSLVLELSLKLPKSDSIIKCCNSILFSDCKDRRLIELSFQYLALYPPSPNCNDLEILIYDVLNRRTNNFIINSFILFFRKQMSLFEMTKVFVERARNIIIYSMKSQKSTLLLRSARIEIVNAINGKEMMNSPSFQFDEYLKEDIKRQRANNCSSSYDTSRIKYIKEQISNNDKKEPVFDASLLWGPKALINMSYFKSSTKNKNQVSAVKRNKIENAFESVEVDDDEDLITDNDRDSDFFRRNDKKKLTESKDSSFSNLQSISKVSHSSSAMIPENSSMAKRNLPLTVNQIQRKNSKLNQSDSKEVFKSRQLASKKKNRSFLSPQRPKQEIRKSPPSKLKQASEKVERKNSIQNNRIISNSSSTSSLNLMKKNKNNIGFNNAVKMKLNLKQQNVNDDDNDVDNDDYEEQVQSWNSNQSMSPLDENDSVINKVHFQIQKQTSLTAVPSSEKEKAGSPANQAKTPTKIRSSQSTTITFKAKKVAGTPQKKPRNGNAQHANNNTNLIRKNFVH